ncbi:hypothetical protein BDW69DRAFT_160363 [Aspergillus filifer]
MARRRGYLSSQIVPRTPVSCLSCLLQRLVGLVMLTNHSQRMMNRDDAKIPLVVQETLAGIGRVSLSRDGAKSPRFLEARSFFAVQKE